MKPTPDPGDELENMIDAATASPAFRAMLQRALERVRKQPPRKSLTQEFMETIARGLKESINRG